MKYDLIIWDFNGTVCDDLDICIECINVVLGKRKMKLVENREQYRNAFCFPISKYYENLGFDFEREPYKVAGDEWVSEYLKRENLIKSSEGVEEVLKKANNEGVKQIILSSCEITMLKRELKQLGLTEYFDDVLGLDNVYAAGKVEIAKKWANGKNYKAVMIGDSVHDYDTAKAIGADIILYSGGHDSKERMQKLGVPVIDKLIDLISII